FALMALTIMGLIDFRLSRAETDHCEITDVQPRRILSSTLNISHLWSKSLKIDSTASNTFLVSTSNTLIAAKYCPEEIISFDQTTGKGAWLSDKVTNLSNLTLDIHRNKAYFSALGE